MSLRERFIAGAKRFGRSLVREEPESISNLFTGYGESRVTKVLAPTLGLGFASIPIVASEGMGYHGSMNFTQMQYIGEPAMLAAEGAVNNAMDQRNINQSITQAPTLGASGALVFGLHQARRG